MALAVFDRALRPVRVRRRKNRPNLVEPYPILVNDLRIQFNTNRRQRPSTHYNLTDPFYLSDLLLQN